MFRLFLENVQGHAIFILDPKGRVQTWNAGAERLLGFAADEITGQPFELFFTPEDRRAGVPEHEVRRALTTGRAADDRWMVRKGGERFWCIGAMSVLRDDSGQVRGFAKIMRDRTDFKRAAEEARQAERRTRAVLESIDDAFLAVDAHWKITYVNGHAERLHGVQRDAVLGRSYWEVFPQAGGGPFEGPIRQAMRDRRPLRVEGRDASLDRWLEVEACPVEGGGLSIYQRDETERKQIEGALRESEQRYRLLVNTVPGVVWSRLPDGSIDFLSDRWYEYTGLSRQGDPGKDWRSVVHPDDLPGVLERWARSAGSGEPYRAEYRVRRAQDGEYRWWLAEGVPVRDDQGAIVRWFGASVDIHEHQLAEQELRDADRRKDEFLAMLAHELRNPLAPIRSAVHVVKLKGFTDPDLVWARDVIDRQVGRMARLLDDLLDVSRIGRNVLELRPGRIDLATVIEGAVETSQPLIEQMRHPLSIQWPDEPIVVEADESRLAQVFSNLLINAAKYSDEGGRIWLTVDRRGDEAVVSVRDEGIGLDPAILPNLFDLFSQAAPARERALGGLGIGLSLVKGLVELHGGTVAVHSEGVGKGSEFLVRLPIAQTAEGPSPPRSSRTILIVDANREAADRLATTFRALGHETQTVSNGEEAVSAVDGTRPAVVLLDIDRPAHDGHEVCRRIRERSWGKSIVIIALSGRGQEADRRKALDNGFDDFLVKPVDAAAFLKRLTGLRTQRV